MPNKTIVYTVDGNEQALKWLEVSLRSARRMLGDEVRIVVCTDSPRDFGYGTECVDVRGRIAALGIDRITQLQWYGKPVAPMQVFRLALPVIEELKDEKRIVFVDADTEFTDARWGEIFTEDLGGAMVGGVKDGGTTNRFIELRHKDFVLTREVTASVPEERLREIRDGSYVNGGVLVMDLEKIRISDFKFQISDDGGQSVDNRGGGAAVQGGFAAVLPRMIDFCVSARLKYLDQDLINLFFKKKLLPSRYNSSAHLHAKGEPTWLEHYTGKEKWEGKVYPPIRYQLQNKAPCNNVPIVYTVGRPSEHDDLELRWSLRSIAKYGRNVGRVIVTSPYKRDWLSPDVEQIEVEDLPTPGYKHHNILNAILKTVELAKLDGEFSVSSDDHFYVKPVDFAAQPMVAQHWTIPHNYGSARNLGTALWMQSCTDTKEFLYQHGLPTIDFQMHRNSRWHGGLVRERMELFKEAFTWRFCVEPHVVMQNLWVHTQPNAKVEFRKDCKIKEFHGIEPWCDCISCYDETFNDKAFMEFMNREFGDKCRYER